jgi:hypothetical protein
MPEELRDLYERQVEELAAQHPDWDELEITETAIQAAQ